MRRFLGDGGMGQICEAEHMDLERPVTMKVLLPALSAAPDALAMFRCEAWAASRLGGEPSWRRAELLAKQLEEATPRSLHQNAN